MSNIKPFALERRMSVSTVNLDALIPREDFETDAQSSGGTLRATISLADLDSNGFFHPVLRKPDFQRETTHWPPEAVCDIIKAYLDGHLIPSIILWQSGTQTFVIDGAHRLSALIAWTRDDYGDGEASNARFGGGLTAEQRKVAKRTRDLIRKEIGTYAEYRGLRGVAIADPRKAKWVDRLGTGAIDLQWVTATNTAAAEASFFKINQAAQPIDPTERRILQSRKSSISIASRCIARGGKGHKYWKGFPQIIREQIETVGEQIYKALYEPPHKEPITTADVPIAGQGYNALPFIFDLVSAANGLAIPEKTSKKISPSTQDDMTGEETLHFPNSVKKKVELISTNASGSLGLHPLVYCYSSSGAFQPNAFLATLKFCERLDVEKKKKDFTEVRMRFENYLVSNRVFVSLTMNRLGAGGRSLDRIVNLYWKIFSLMKDGVANDDLFLKLTSDQEFAHLKQLEVPTPNADAAPSKSGASKATQSFSYIRVAMETPVRCPICGAAIHANSMTFDHAIRRSEGGDNRSENIQPTHPFCNSGVKG